MDAVGPGREVPRAAHGAERVLGLDRVLRGLDRDLAGNQHELIFADDAVPRGRAHRERSAAVDREVCLAEHRAVDVRLVVGSVLPRRRQSVLCVVRERDPYLLGRADEDGRGVRARDARAVEHKLDLLAVGVDHDLPVGKRPRDHVGARGGNGHRGAVRRRARARDRAAGVGKLDRRRLAGLVARVEVAVAHVVGRLEQVGDVLGRRRQLRRGDARSRGARGRARGPRLSAARERERERERPERRREPGRAGPSCQIPRAHC